MTGVSGVSNYNITDKIIYGGIAGTCPVSAKDTDNTCNSCVASTLTACNKTSVYPELKMKLTFKTDKTGLSSTATYVVLKSASSTSTSFVVGTISKAVTVTTNSDFTISVTWAELCGILGEGSTCATNTFETLTGSVDIGLDAGNDGTPDSDQTTTIAFKLNKIDSTNTHYDVLSATCPLGSSVAVGYDPGTGSGASSNVGICDFTVFPGDEKIYLTEFRKGAFGSDGILTPQFDSFAYSTMLLFYAPVTTTESAAIDAINNSSESKEFSYKVTDSEVEINDNRATGFDNNQKYCFISANKNIAGNIFYFAPATAIKLDPVNHCATPSEVVGLLDNKHCFIATATFGSPLAPEVQTFREFRNQYLLQNDWGRKFVKLYYKYSPPLANQIASHEFLKWSSWAFLWPLSLWIKLVFLVGLLPSLLALFLLLIFIRLSLRKILLRVRQ